MPPIEIDKILSDPLLIVAAVLLVVSPVLFLIAFVKYLRAPARAPFAIPHHVMESPIPARTEALERPGDNQSLAPLEQLAPAEPAPPKPPASALTPDAAPAEPATANPPAMAAAPAEEAATPPAPVPPASYRPSPRRADDASEKTVVMPPGMAEMQSEMDIALSQLRVMNKRLAALEAEVARLRAGRAETPGGQLPPQPL